MNYHGTNVCRRPCNTWLTNTDTQNRLESWQKFLTDNGLKINVAKTEHLSTRENPLPIKLNGEELKNVDHFKYLRSVIDKDVPIDRWAMKVTNKKKIATTEMSMLRGILEVSRRDHMRNEEIRRILHLSPIDEVMRSGLLRWFGHVQRRDATNVTRRVMEMAIPGTRRQGRPKKTWHQQMKEDMAGLGVTQDVALDRKEWRRRTRPTPMR